MHPLLFWSYSTSELAEREREAVLLRRRRDSGIEQPPPLTRDDRWRRAIHRFSATTSPEVPLATSADPRLGCA